MKPCPRCGSTDLESVLQVGVAYIEHVGCRKGPEVVVAKFSDEKTALSEAIRLWNEENKCNEQAK